MKKIEIRSKRQENGLWGMPINCERINRLAPILDSKKELLWSAMVIAIGEQYSHTNFDITLNTDECIIVKIHNLSTLFKLKYCDYEVIGNTLYAFDDSKEHQNFLRKNKLNNLSEYEKG